MSYFFPARGRLRGIGREIYFSPGGKKACRILRPLRGFHYPFRKGILKQSD
jgi:hypothetical protein